MFYEVEWTGTGIFAMLQEPTFPKWLRSQVRKAHRRAWTEWATTTGARRHGLRSRFGRGAFAKHGLTRRSPGYRRRQLRILGGEMPYQSPDRRPLALHMRGKMTTEGVGWRLTLRNATQEVVSVFNAAPGAKALNFHPQYRREFLALDRKAAESAEIMDRIAELTWEAVAQRAARVSRRQIRSAA